MTTQTEIQRPAATLPETAPVLLLIAGLATPFVGAALVTDMLVASLSAPRRGARSRSPAPRTPPPSRSPARSPS